MIFNELKSLASIVKIQFFNGLSGSLDVFFPTSIVKPVSSNLRNQFLKRITLALNIRNANYDDY